MYCLDNIKEKPFKFLSIAIGVILLVLLIIYLYLYIIDSMTLDNPAGSHHSMSILV